jgi:hypothetical protein
MLCHFLALEFARYQIEMLISCAGPGTSMMLALHKTDVPSATPKKSAAPKTLAQVLPHNTCHMDVQSSISVVCQHVNIKVGEIKSSMSGMRKARIHIQVQANLVKWAVQKLHTDITEVALQDHIFVSKDILQDDTVTAAPYLHQDISIFVHRL